jgi:hypothetical protein
VTTSTYKNYAGLSHGEAVTKPELLGILIKRCVIDCATARSMRGHVLNGVRSCINIQAGRVIKPPSLVAFNTSSSRVTRLASCRDTDVRSIAVSVIYATLVFLIISNFSIHSQP